MRWVLDEFLLLIPYAQHNEIIAIERKQDIPILPLSLHQKSFNPATAGMQHVTHKL
jgi:hypothetical protein